jgi:exo-beta-1,3-glucanase (GH17 family)
MGYSPYNENQSPGGILPSSEQISTDIKILKEITNEIRLYETASHTQQIVAIAEEHKIKVHMSISIDQDNTDWQIDQVTKIVNKYPQTIKSIILEKGTRGTGSIPVSSLESAITQIKESLDSDVPITVAESFPIWIKNPEIYSMLDYALLVSYGYWEGLSVEDSVTMSIEDGKYLQDLSGLNVVIETGYPSDGAIIDCAIPSTLNQADFIMSFVDKVKQEKMNYVLFSAFSENWKPRQEVNQQNNSKCGGEVIESRQNAENNWGLFSADRKIQQNLSGFALDYVNELEIPRSVLTINSNTQCDIMFKPDIKTKNIDKNKNSIIINFHGGTTKIHDIKVFHEDTGKLIQEVTADYPFKIIISSHDVNKFANVLIGVNCGVSDISNQEIYDIKETQLVNMQDFNITIAVIPYAYAVCPTDEQCIPIEIPDTEWVDAEDHTILIVIGILCGISSGVFLFLRQKKKKTKKDYSSLNILYRD